MRHILPFFAEAAGTCGDVWLEWRFRASQGCLVRASSLCAQGIRFIAFSVVHHYQVRVQSCYIIFAINANLRIRLANMLISHHNVSKRWGCRPIKSNGLHQHTKMTACSSVRLQLALDINHNQVPALHTEQSPFVIARVTGRLFNHMARQTTKRSNMAE